MTSAASEPSASPAVTDAPTGSDAAEPSTEPSAGPDVTDAAAATGTPVEGGELRVVAPVEPSSLDPITGVSGGDHMSLYPLYDRLLNFEPETLEAVPGLAT